MSDHDLTTSAELRTQFRPTTDSEASGIDPSPATLAALKKHLALLPRLDLHALRVEWRKLTRSAIPEHLSRPLLLRLVAYKLQARVYGDLDLETVRYLNRIAKERARRRAAGEVRVPKQPPPIPPVPAPSGHKSGTLIGREYNGIMHRVKVVDGGYLWNGSTYKSLSEIARSITGTRWNGPRFFGLRDRRPAPGVATTGQGDSYV